MDTAQLTLSELRRRLGAERDAARRLAWCERLEADARAGARQLAAQQRRRLARDAAEAARVRSLFELRARLLREGARHVAGVDEVGVGPLAGPVVAAAVVLQQRVDLPGLDDSKKLSPRARQEIEPRIREQALGIGVGCVEPDAIDRRGILEASLEAMRRAVESLRQRLVLSHLLIDARRLPEIAIPQTALVHGDAIDGSIAAASIVAKVHRDALMRELDRRHPGYGFGRHMGYGTAQHMAALERLGPSPIHRRSFAPVAAAGRR